jgi:hypothetical protein
MSKTVSKEPGATHLLQFVTVLLQGEHYDGQQDKACCNAVTAKILRMYVCINRLSQTQSQTHFEASCSF